MKGAPQGSYTREFRQEAVKQVTEEKLSLPEAARQLSLAPSILSYWKVTLIELRTASLKLTSNLKFPDNVYSWQSEAANSTKPGRILDLK